MAKMTVPLTFAFSPFPLRVVVKTSTAKQVLGNCERMVLANFIGN